MARSWPRPPPPSRFDERRVRSLGIWLRHRCSARRDGLDRGTEPGRTERRVVVADVVGLTGLGLADFLLGRISNTIDALGKRGDVGKVATVMGLANLPEIAGIMPVELREKVCDLIIQLANMLMEKKRDRHYPTPLQFAADAGYWSENDLSFALRSRDWADILVAEPGKENGHEDRPRARRLRGRLATGDSLRVTSRRSGRPCGALRR